MPVHDWTIVDAGVFHHFHLGWITSVRNLLKRTYMEAWQGVPRRWREVIDKPKLET